MRTLGPVLDFHRPIHMEPRSAKVKWDEVPRFWQMATCTRFLQAGSQFRQGALRDPYLQRWSTGLSTLAVGQLFRESMEKKCQVIWKALAREHHRRFCPQVN